MKILVFAQHLELGGTQVNAIELAAALRDVHGFEVVLFAGPGPMAKVVHEKGLRLLLAPEATYHPSPVRIRALCSAVREERPDILHVWDWWQCLDAYYAVHLRRRIPMVVSDMMMGLTRLLPKNLPTTFGTPEVVDQAKAAGRGRVELMLPPVDVHLNAPNRVDSASFRRRYGIEDGDVTLVTVSRLAHWMKSESLLRTIDAVRTLGRDLPLRFVIVGEGTAQARLQQLADKVNNELKRSAVILAGALVDPRPAYAAADVVVGMGGSALRGMAFGKPVIIVGERSFSATLTPETAASFYYKGIYGVGCGDPSNSNLVAHIRRLANHPGQRSILGQFARQFVVQHFALETISARFAEFCRCALAEKPRFGTAAVDGLRTAAVYLRERRFLTPSRSPAPVASLQMPASH
jgi:glycosyltransferase involved in cell wall biosynthesis